MQELREKLQKITAQRNTIKGMLRALETQRSQAAKILRLAKAHSRKIDTLLHITKILEAQESIKLAEKAYKEAKSKHAAVKWEFEVVTQREKDARASLKYAQKNKGNSLESDAQITHRQHGYIGAVYDEKSNKIKLSVTEKGRTSNVIVSHVEDMEAFVARLTLITETMRAETSNRR